MHKYQLKVTACICLDFFEAAFTSVHRRHRHPVYFITFIHADLSVQSCARLPSHTVEKQTVAGVIMTGTAPLCLEKKALSQALENV